MAEKTSRKTAGSKSGKNASGKTANASKVSSAKDEAKAAGVKKNPEGSRTADAITAIISIAVSIFTIIALLTEKTGQVGMILSLFLKGMLGMVAYILPFYVIVHAVLMLARRVAHANSRTVLFTIILICDIAMLNSIRFEHIRSSEFYPNYMVDMFQEGTNLNSAGLVGMTLGRLACQLVDIAGLIIIGIVVLIICVILVADTPISQYFDQLRIKRNQKKINRLTTKTESGISDSKADTQPIPIIPDNQETAAGKKNGAGNASPSESCPPSADSAGGPDWIQNGADASAEDEGRGFFRKPSFLSGFSWRKADEETIPVNKRQILQYMNDENLFNENGENGRGDQDSENGRETGLTSDDIEKNLNCVNGSKRPSVSSRDRYDDDFHRNFPSFDEGSEGNSGDYYDSPGMDGEESGQSDSPEGEEDDLYDPFEAALDRLLGEGTGTGRGNRSPGVPSSGKDGSGDLLDTRVFSKSDMDGAGEKHDPASQPSAAGSVEKPAASVLSASAKKAAVAAAAANSLEQVSEEAENSSAQPEKTYVLPPLYLLEEPRKKNSGGQAELRQKAETLEKVLHDFGVNARVINVNRGPSITRYEIQPATGVKVSSIVRLSDDIALNLRAKSLRIEAPIPGKAAIGIEVQNDRSDIVSIREMIESEAFQKAESKISFSVGEDITGNAVIADLKKMPHMLIAGSTGSGKSVCINSILISILYRSTPDEVKLILIDPKVVELGNYNGIPHMLIPVVTDPAKAAAALMWAVHEMEGRYKKFAAEKVKNLAGYNTKMKREGRPEEVMPQIVIIIDELADLMMAAAKQVEESICRLAQLARAAGMHMIVATQRPSVDVVTGLIKANVPSRIAFAVSSQVDSRTILDRAGAEKLVGNGDMLFSPLGSSHPQRLQGPFVTDDEVAAVIDFWKEQAGDDGAPEEIRQKVMQEINTVTTDFSSGDDDEDEDELYSDAVQLVVDSGQASASMLQRRFRIGYNRAGRLIDTMESRGIIGPSEGSRPRKVLISKEEYEAGFDMDDDLEILEQDSFMDRSMPLEEE